MHVLVVTVVHHPQDARILFRQVRALTDAGHTVTYVAPWTATGAVPPPGVVACDVPRAIGRHRVAALRAARRRVRQQAPDADIVVAHDPELVAALGGIDDPPTVWDVHEDTGAALIDKPWLPDSLRPAARLLVDRLEARAQRHMHLMLAEQSYQERFSTAHPVVPNDPPVRDHMTDPGDSRIVYLGRLSAGRGVPHLLAVAERLPAGVSMELIGPADAAVRPDLKAAHRKGLIRWHGFVPNDRALDLLDGALAGLSLLTDKPNYRHSRPTKIVEYMSRGLPVITTPLPLATEIVDAAECGITVPFDDAGAVVAGIERLRSDSRLRVDMGRRGFTAARNRFNWHHSGGTFVRRLEHWAGFAVDVRAEVALPEPMVTITPVLDVPAPDAATVAWDAMSMFERDASSPLPAAATRRA